MCSKQFHSGNCNNFTKEFYSRFSKGIYFASQTGQNLDLKQATHSIQGTISSYRLGNCFHIHCWIECYLLSSPSSPPLHPQDPVGFPFITPSYAWLPYNQYYCSAHRHSSPHSPSIERRSTSTSQSTTQWIFPLNNAFCLIQFLTLYSLRLQNLLPLTNPYLLAGILVLSVFHQTWSNEKNPTPPVFFELHLSPRLNHPHLPQNRTPSPHLIPPLSWPLLSPIVPVRHDKTLSVHCFFSYLALENIWLSHNVPPSFLSAFCNNSESITNSMSYLRSCPSW